MASWHLLPGKCWLTSISLRIKPRRITLGPLCELLQNIICTEPRLLFLSTVAVCSINNKLSLYDNVYTKYTKTGFCVYVHVVIVQGSIVISKLIFYVQLFIFVSLQQICVLSNRVILNVCNL